jgi:hypothetical protein
MSGAYWFFSFIGDLDQLGKDLDAYERPAGVTLWYSASKKAMAVQAEDNELGGRETFPYPNQIAFLDYITETPAYKSGQYKFPIGITVGRPHGWDLVDYLEAKAK